MQKQNQFVLPALLSIAQGTQLIVTEIDRDVQGRCWRCRKFNSIVNVQVVTYCLKMVVRQYNEELKYLEKINPTCWRIKKGFQPNMNVSLTVVVRQPAC